MRKHRRKTRYRKITIAAVAISAVSVPSVAMACLDGPQEGKGRPSQDRKSTSFDQRWTASNWDPISTARASQTPVASPSAPTTAAPESGISARIVELVNNERSKAGCAPLATNAKLEKAAQDHSKDMADHENMSHTGSDGSSPDDRITRAGYSWSTYGENVAYGYTTPERVMEGWMSSPGHKRNILDCAFKEIGVGLAQPGNYWAQDFGAAR
ncbi:CAP domain-containing protein [Streptomyces halobius]|uniref:CAP domain-containing protein n=1 Tax=Streptomyces halobius TaxID=2879846 RepID=A0ABY4M2D7_9ACTN|nr:CAP domain-containing protein [Streptomyces halobius]UQA91875.1 CAP domain-containing protein [Streptomyces halobius]